MGSCQQNQTRAPHRAWLQLLPLGARAPSKHCSHCRQLWIPPWEPPRPGSCQEELPPLHPRSLKSQVWLGGRPEGLVLKAGREREAGGPGSSQGLKSGSARGSGDPWAQAQLQRHVDTWHSHTQTHSRGTHAGMLQTRVCLCGHMHRRAQVHIHTLVRILKWTCANTHTDTFVCTGILMWSQTRRYASTHPGWAQVYTRAPDTHRSTSAHMWPCGMACRDVLGHTETGVDMHV